MTDMPTNALEWLMVYHGRFYGDRMPVHGNSDWQLDFNDSTMRALDAYARVSADPQPALFQDEPDRFEFRLHIAGQTYTDVVHMPEDCLTSWPDAIRAAAHEAMRTVERVLGRD